MGTYLNPGNSGFAEMLKSDYVDKTGLTDRADLASPVPLRCYVRIERSFPEVSQKKRSCDCDQ